jgi:hypothetical protein
MQDGAGMWIKRYYRRDGTCFKRSFNHRAHDQLMAKV